MTLPVSASVFTVTNTNDTGQGSLRQAILDAEATPGSDVISFSLTGSGPYTIAPLSALPSLREPVTIDGRTQPGYAGRPLIELRGDNAGATVSGLSLLTSNCVIKALAINRFTRDGIRIENYGSNVVQGCHVGTDVWGTNAFGNNEGGITILSAGNLVGGTAPAERNVISGGNLAGVYLLNATARFNQVSGNYIGLDATGGRRLGNVQNGIVISGAPENVIGGTAPGAGNVISGNGQSGLYVMSPGAASNRVEGNFIGTDAGGLLARSNAADGVTLYGATQTIIGGTNPAAGNVISGNGLRGIYVTVNPLGGTSNLVQGNFVGTTVGGTNALPNASRGIELYKASYNTIGGGNVISGNALSGVALTGGTSTNNRIVGNLIGTGVSGLTALANGYDGVLLSRVSNNVVGGLTPAERNVISGNGQNGVYLAGAEARSNTVAGNFIGTDRTGTEELGNQFSGVLLEGPGNVVGGDTSGAGNLISANLENGVFLYESSASNNVIAGNLIGLDPSSSYLLGNYVAGIGLTNAPNNLIGGTTPGARNVISANGDSGVYLQGAGATRNLFQGNLIGCNATGTQMRPNLYDGITGYDAPSNTVGGVIAGARNLIAGNGWDGVYLTGAGTRGWVIQGNFIGTAADGVGNLGNRNHNIEALTNASSHTIGGTAAGAGNRIAFARSLGWDGVRIRDGSTNILVVGNALWANGGTNAAGLGIDLGPDGVTPNDNCDADTGGNNLQNFPVLSAAYGSSTGTGVRGTLNSKAGATFAVDFYANVTNEPSGYGEGQIYLGRTSVQTAGNCATNFTASLPVAAPVGYFVTATATDSANNTSEFSQGIAVVPQPALALTNLAAARQLRLSWPTNTPGFVLQQTAALTPPVNWSVVSNSISVSGGQFVFTGATTNGSRFYRLILQ